MPDLLITLTANHVLVERAELESITFGTRVIPAARAKVLGVGPSILATGSPAIDVGCEVLVSPYSGVRVPGTLDKVICALDDILAIVAEVPKGEGDVRIEPHH